MNAIRRGVGFLVSVAKKRGGDARKRVQRRLLSSSMTPEDIESFRERMFAHWRSLGHSPATCEMFLRDAFNTDGYVYAVSIAQRVMGDLRGKRVLDVGCGWGGLSRILSECGAEVTMVDPFPPHVEIARARAPRATGFIGSGVELSESGLADAQFDHVFVHDVIEHVGMPPDHRGDAHPVLETQQRVISEAARVLKPGGTFMVSTGNYLFPYDGEVQIWFFHYLPRPVQAEILQTIGRSADRYGLLTWAQLVHMTESAGLALAHVETCETDGFLKTVEDCMSPLFGSGSDSRHQRMAMDRIRRMVTTDPNWMPMWHAFFRKPVVCQLTE